MVELLSFLGNDLMVVNAARVSYGKCKDILDEKDVKLINFLYQKGHTAPFRHPQLQFRIECPIYVERQLFKHQIGLTANSISGRYVDFSDSYTRIQNWRQQSKSSKQGSEGLVDNQDECHFIESDVIDFCSNAYKRLIELGVAKEQARTILPLCLDTKFIWTGSLLAFLHLWKLRIKPDAQQETMEIAQEMLNLVKNIENKPFQHSLEAFGW